MLSDVRLFVVTANSHSFSQAARYLGVLPSAITRKIGALERELGAALFVRSTRHLELTEAGRVYLKAAQAALEEIEQGKIAVANLGSEVRGTLVVETLFMLGSKIVASALPELNRRHPNLKVELRTSHNPPLGISQGVDVAVRYELGHDSELIARKFAVSRRVVVASPAYLKRRGVPRHPQDLINHDCIQYAPSRRPLTWYFRGPGYEGSFHPQGVFQTNDGFSMLAAAVDGLGVSSAHDWMVAPQLRSGALQRILEDYEIRTLASFETPLYMIYSAQLRRTPKLRAFVACMLDIYGNRLIQI